METTQFQSHQSFVLNKEMMKLKREERKTKRIRKRKGIVDFLHKAFVSQQETNQIVLL